MLKSPEAQTLLKQKNKSVINFTFQRPSIELAMASVK